jgi:hypothetical protein
MTIIAIVPSVIDGDRADITEECRRNRPCENPFH